MRVLACVILATCAGMAYAEQCPGCVTGVIDRIIDGDTLEIGGERIRLALVDTPERGAPGYEEAAAFAADVCRPGTEATYDIDGGQLDGSHGRTIAEVFCGGDSLNAELLLHGHARTLDFLCDASEFASRPWSGCHMRDPGIYAYVIIPIIAAAMLLVYRSRRNLGTKPGHL